MDLVIDTFIPPDIDHVSIYTCVTLINEVFQVIDISNTRWFHLLTALPNLTQTTHAYRTCSERK